MPNNTAPCRVCGKDFVPCGKSSAEIGAFNYKEVACSPECGQEYLRRVLEGRKNSTKIVTVETKTEQAPVETTNETQDEKVSEDNVTVLPYKKYSKKKDESEDNEN